MAFPINSIYSTSNSIGTKTVTIPAPPATNQNTWIDAVQVNCYNASAAGFAMANVQIPVAASLNQAGTATPVTITAMPLASAAGASASEFVQYPSPGLQVRDTNGTVAVTCSASPNSQFATIDFAIWYHYS